MQSGFFLIASIRHHMGRSVGGEVGKGLVGDAGLWVTALQVNEGTGRRTQDTRCAFISPQCLPPVLGKQ